jgi:DNA-binding GntR family transcriptional regulator
MSAENGHLSAMPPGAACVRAAVRSGILRRQLRAGDLLDEERLAGRLGCERADVREALEELAHEGVVVLAPDQGALVAGSISPADLAEADEVRQGLWCVAVRRFVARASDAQVKALRRAVAEFRRVAEQDPRPEELARARDWCYQVLLRAAGGGLTASLLGEVCGRVELVLAAALGEPGRALEVARELEAVCRALAARDESAAVSACVQHLDRSRASGLRLLAATA